MDLECLLFRVHKSLLTFSKTKQIVSILFKATSISIFFYLIYFVVLNLIQISKQPCTNNIEFMNQTQFKNETLFKIFIYDKDEIYQTYKYSKQSAIYSLPEEILKKHNISIEEYKIDKKCYAQNWVEDLILTQSNIEILFLNDLIQKLRNVNETHYLLEIENNKVLIWMNKLDLEEEKNPISEKFLKTFAFIIKCTIYLFCQTCIASLIIKILQFGIPILLNAGWYRLYQRILINNNKQSHMLKISYLLLFFVFFQVYQSRTLLTYIYYNQATIQSQKNLLLLILFNEIMSNFFFRTRSTLLFAPKYLVSYYILFFIYMEGTNFAFYYHFVNILWLLSIATVLAFLHFYEIPAIQEWNEASFYTPKITRPRTLYFPLTQLEWKVDIPQIWTMFYPLHGRQYFNVENLSLVDDNQDLLNNYLQQNAANQ
ncbi:unnamed protein product [Paramecium primaurelia]|uniref:Transmembrane protein n=1 Tax=Paramecium primaurelia TaxID=5886 RepID=A0A8S1L1H7_PARPR|nr:unnamed protein product [Paramecium primaurelia]